MMRTGISLVKKLKSKLAVDLGEEGTAARGWTTVVPSDRDPSRGASLLERLDGLANMFFLRLGVHGRVVDPAVAVRCRLVATRLTCCRDLSVNKEEREKMNMAC